MGYEETYKKRYGPAAEAVINLKKLGRDKLPWAKAYANAKARCQKQNEAKYKYYGARGIECHIKPTDVKMAYYRDKAYEMKCPSLDRIDPLGHYTVDNIRFIEFEENRKMRLMNHPANKVKYEAIKRQFQEQVTTMKLDNRTIRAVIRKLYLEYGICHLPKLSA